MTSSCSGPQSKQAGTTGTTLFGATPSEKDARAHQRPFVLRRKGFEAQFPIALGQDPLDGPLLEFPGECENGAQYGAQAFKLPLQPVQFAALRIRGAFVTPAGELLREHPEKIPLFGVQLDAAFDGGVVEHVGSVAHRQQGRMMFLAVRQFAIDEGRDERERGE
jgi:hypothetical protein